MSQPDLTAQSQKPTPLQGIKVLDLSRVLAGPWASQLLADYGADVIKVEKPEVGDDTRTWGPPWWEPQNQSNRDASAHPTQRVAAYFVCANRGKRSVTIDITSPEGQAQIRCLASEADILLENYKVGQLAKYGLDAASLQTLNPGLVYCSITGYGQTGPLAHKAGYDFAIQAEGGLMSITGEPSGEPQKVGVAVTDIMTGLYACNAILAALHERQRTGQGCVIDAALFDVQVAMLANQASNQLIGRTQPARMGNTHPNIVPYQVFATQDGYTVLAIGNDGQFARFCEQAGHPEVAQDERFATNPQRVKNRSTLVPMLAQWTLQRTTADWVQRLETAAVPCSPILNVAEVLEHPQTLARDMVVGGDVDQPPMVVQPVRINGQRPVSASPPPALGEHQAEWLKQQT